MYRALLATLGMLCALMARRLFPRLCASLSLAQATAPALLHTPSLLNAGARERAVAPAAKPAEPPAETPAETPAVTESARAHS